MSDEQSTSPAEASAEPKPEPTLEERLADAEARAAANLGFAKTLAAILTCSMKDNAQRILKIPLVRMERSYDREMVAVDFDGRTQTYVVVRKPRENRLIVLPGDH